MLAGGFRILPLKLALEDAPEALKACVQHEDGHERWHVRAWIWLVQAFRYICLGVCIARLVYAHGPAFTDHASTAATVVLHAHLIYAPMVLRKLVTSRTLQRVIDEVVRGENNEGLVRAARHPRHARRRVHARLLAS